MREMLVRHEYFQTKQKEDEDEDDEDDDKKYILDKTKCHKSVGNLIFNEMFANIALNIAKLFQFFCAHTLFELFCRVSNFYIHIICNKCSHSPTSQWKRNFLFEHNNLLQAKCKEEIHVRADMCVDVVFL